MEFEYFYTQQVNGVINIHDMFNCAIDASSDDNKHYYLIIKTQLGSTRIFEYGPYIPDMPILYDTSYSFKKMTCDDRKIGKIVENFLNNPHRNITQAIEVDEQQVYENCINIVDNIRRDEYD